MHVKWRWFVIWLSHEPHLQGFWHSEQFLWRSAAGGLLDVWKSSANTTEHRLIMRQCVCRDRTFFSTCCKEALITGVPMNWSNYHIYQGCQTHFCVSLSGPLWLWILWNCVNVWHLWYIYEFTLVHSCLSGWKVSLPNFWRIAIVSLINRVMRQTERSVIQQGCERNKGRTVRWNLSIRYFICSRTVREAT